MDLSACYLSLRYCSHAGSWSHTTIAPRGRQAAVTLGAPAFTDDRASKPLSPGGEALEGITHQHADEGHKGHDHGSEHPDGVER